MLRIPPVASASPLNPIDSNRDGGPREWLKSLVKGKKAQQIVAAPLV
jgi:hypothetical protein